MVSESICHAISRRESRRQDRRDAIITVATESFLEKGYAGTTMSEIAATLGGSKGTLWSYFPSKEALFEAVIDKATAAYRARLSELLSPGGPVGPTLKRFCTGIMEKVTSPPALALHRLVVAESGRFPEIGKIFYNRGPRPTWALLATFLSAAMERGALRRADSLEAARLLTSLCMAGCHHEMAMGSRDSVSPEAIEFDVDRALDLFLRAYAMEA